MSYTSKVTSKTPWKQRWKHSDEELQASARPFKHRSEWKTAHPELYNAAWRRGIIYLCCAHMTPMASPYGKDYEIYAYEFTDHHAYVGLTFLPRARDAMHKARGPVAEHAKVCQEFTRKVVSSGLTREEVPRAEQTLIEHYRKCGWTMLNKNTGGSTGSLRGRKWTREAVLAEALKFATKQAWIDGSQMSYRVAKREDWFDEASAHMPKRDPTSLIGRKVSAATRRKQGLAKQGKNLTEAHRAKISESLRRHWNPPVVKK